MNKKSGATKSHKQHLAQALEQMDSWMQKETNVALWIFTALVPVVLRGRVVGRQEEMYLFDTPGGVCRVPIILGNYDQVLLNKTDPGWVTLKSTSGELRLVEDAREWVAA